MESQFFAYAVHSIQQLIGLPIVSLHEYLGFEKSASYPEEKRTDYADKLFLLFRSFLVIVGINLDDDIVVILIVYTIYFVLNTRI